MQVRRSWTPPRERATGSAPCFNWAPSMERAWEEERLARRTAALIARRERPLTPERSPSRGARAAEWFLHRLDAATSADEPIRARFEPATGDIPARLKSAMMECQKPFQLWNVTRIAEVARLAFEALPPYKVGSAGLEPADREGRPGRVVPASRLLRGAREEAEL